MPRVRRRDERGGGDVFFAKLKANDGGHLSSMAFGDAEAQFNARIAVSSDGEVFLGSTGFGVMNFGMGNLPSAGVTDVFLAKFNVFGGPMWHARYGDAEPQFLSGLTTDAAGNLLLIGTFGGTIDFGGQPLVGTGNTMFLAAIKGFDGERLWSRAFNSSVAITPHAVAADAGGNVLVAGIYDGTVSVGGEAHTSVAGPDAFIAKLNSAGIYVWSKSWGSDGVQRISSVGADANGDVYVAGSFENGMMLPDGSVVTSKGGRDPFIAKLDGTTGDHLWVRAFGDEGSNQEAEVVAVDASGNLIVAGRFDGALEFDSGSFEASGPLDLFVAKVSPMGDLLWFKQGQGTASASVKGLAVAEDGRTAVVGSFAGALSFGGEAIQGQPGSGDAFVALLWPP